MNKTLRNLALVALVAAPFSAFAEIAGSGTEADPYQIATKEDLGKANTKVEKGKVIFFVQTADIDMAGVENYSAINGTWGDYSSAIVYDGCNHVIKNFAPKYLPNSGANGYYCTSIFGVMTGKVKNLGVINANVDTSSDAGQGASILAAYFGYSTGAGLKVGDSNLETSTFENVYVTGSLKAGSKYTGAFAGTTSSPVKLTNCFANVNVEVAGGPAGAMVGRVNNPTTLTSCYVAGTVNSACSLVSGSGSGSVTANGVVAFNTGSTSVCASTADAKVTMANTDATKNAGIDAVKAWPAFSKTKLVGDYPALNYVLSGAGTEASPYIIATVEDLCNAYTNIDCATAKTYYFKQTADIDMEGVTDYHAFLGYTGIYLASVNYDGQNHVIKNFAPNAPAWKETDKTEYYYCASVFGAGGGEVKNLGVVNATCLTDHGEGILFAYAGTGESAPLTVSNVFVQGKVSGEGGYTGGMFGTSGNKITMTNCFANVEVEGKACTAGLLGRLKSGHELALGYVYVAGTVEAEGACLVCNAEATKGGTINAKNVVAFNTGSTVLCSADVTAKGTISVPDKDNTEGALITTITGWKGFTDKLFMGYPMLEGFEGVETTGVFDAVVSEAEANGPAVYYNLQGVRVANPENGIYIVRRGNKVTKELVK